MKPEATRNQIVTTGRIVTVVGAFIAILITLAINSIKGLNLFDVFQSVLGFIAPPMSVVFLFGVLWSKTTRRAADSILIFGTLLSLTVGVLFLWIFPKEIYDFWPHFLLLSFYLFVVLSIAIVIISLLDSKNTDTENTLLPVKKVTMTLRAKLLWVLLFIVMLGLYLFFNGN